MDLHTPQLADYLDDFSRNGDPLLARMEERARSSDFPIVGPASGRFCYLVSRMLGARRIFELGSGFGYSTIWFARAVAENGGGEVFHTVWDEKLSREARGFIAEAGLDQIVRFQVSEAVEALEASEGLFDVIFVDIEKEDYPKSLAVVKRKLRKGGAMIIDNMLWYGRIFDAQDRSASTEGVREASRLIQRDSDWNSSLIPIRDGLIVALKTV